MVDQGRYVHEATRGLPIIGESTAMLKLQLRATGKAGGCRHASNRTLPALR